MNDFHILSICIHNKDVAGAMRVLRDKSEFAVRKILEKLKVRMTAQTGRAFWHAVQNWLLTACRQGNTQHESIHTRCTSQPAESWQVQSCSAGCDQARGASGHANRSHQYGVYDSSSTADVCAWPDGLPPVHAYMGDERASFAGTSPDESKPSVDLGGHHTASIQSGLPASPAVVGNEHSVCVRRRDAAARPAAPLRKKGVSCRRIAPGAHDISASAGKLWSGRHYAGHQPGSYYERHRFRKEGYSHVHCRALTSLLKRLYTSAQHARRDIIIGHPAYTGIPPDCVLFMHGYLPGRSTTFYAP